MALSISRTAKKHKKRVCERATDATLILVTGVVFAQDLLRLFKYAVCNEANEKIVFI